MLGATWGNLARANPTFLRGKRIDRYTVDWDPAALHALGRDGDHAGWREYTVRTVRALPVHLDNRITVAWSFI